MKWWLKAMSQYADFSGRARRQEFWMFWLFTLLFAVACGLIDGLTGTYSVEAGVGLVGGLFSLATLIPSIAVSIRRLHDIGRSGWFILLGLIPIVGIFIMLVFYFKDSEKGVNKWGRSPKYGDAEPSFG